MNAAWQILSFVNISKLDFQNAQSVQLGIMIPLGYPVLLLYLAVLYGNGDTAQDVSNSIDSSGYF